MPLKRDQKPVNIEPIEVEAPPAEPILPPKVDQAVSSLFSEAAQAVPERFFRHNFHNAPIKSTQRKRLHDSTAVVAALERLVRTIGSVSGASRHLNMSRPFISMVLSGARQPSRELCQALGYVPVLMYARAFGAERDSWAAQELAETEDDAKA